MWKGTSFDGGSGSCSNFVQTSKSTWSK
jgi:hypothetical protein